MVIGIELCHRRNWCNAHPCVLRLHRELVDRLCRQPLPQIDTDQVGVFTPSRLGCYRIERCPFGVTHQLNQRLPLLLLRADDRHQTIGALEDAPWHHCLRPEARRINTKKTRSSGCELGKFRTRRVHGEVDVFALPGAGRVIDGRCSRCSSRGRHIDRGVVAGGLEWRQRYIGGRARREKSPTRPVNHGQLFGGIVVVRAGLAERRDRQRDEPRPRGSDQFGGKFRPRTVVYHQISVAKERIDGFIQSMPDRPFIRGEPSV